MLAVLSANSEAASGRRRELPSSIKFIHLDALQAATNAYGEAAGLIMGVVQLLRQAEIWSKFQALDSYCDNLLSNWEPPWVPEDLEEEERRAAREMNLNRLAQEDESTVYDWAMALDGFLSFVANLAVAARVHAAGEVETERFHIEELQKEPSGSFTPSQSSELSKAKPALVVVVPDMTDWHLEVFGPLLRALKIFMLAEQAWRADFDAASSVPFSVEAAVRAGG
ncbi:unnamed protein product [Effrenium voratum]|uniref:Uncharacterized protein n=1 Tax=Effrenium voratum TaxID=2562239 RepID=A0AA36MKE4_9DINO|nr:unnamed protein product [Effrenium voratum]